MRNSGKLNIKHYLGLSLIKKIMDFRRNDLLN